MRKVAGRRRGARKGREVEGGGDPKNVEGFLGSAWGAINAGLFRTHLRFPRLPTAGLIPVWILI